MNETNKYKLIISAKTKDKFRRTDITNGTQIKAIYLPLTLEEIVLNLIGNGELVMVDSKETINIDDTLSYFKIDRLQDLIRGDTSTNGIKLYVEFILWTIKWKKISNSVLSLAPQNTKQWADNMPQLLFDKEEILDTIKRLDEWKGGGNNETSTK